MSAKQSEDNVSDGFGRLVWLKDRMLLDDLVFRLEHYKNDAWELGDDCFSFVKVKELVDQYSHFWKLRGSFRAERLFELGIWDGGSIAFWTEMLQPKKHVAIDISDKRDSPYFNRYVEARRLHGRVASYWKTDQSDRKELERILHEEFDGPLDLVIDDASHDYHLTKTSFETLFPHLRAGGFYIIEDWAWAHWKGFEDFGSYPSPTKLVFELVEATGSSKTLISNVAIYEGFAVVEKGGNEATAESEFSLDRHIYRRPPKIANSGWGAPMARIRSITKRILK